MKLFFVHLLFLCLWSSSPRRAYSYSLSRADCPVDFLKCEKGVNVLVESPLDCFLESGLCNNVPDCTDGSDEKYCKLNYNWGSDGYAFRFHQGTCPDESVMCLKPNELSPCISVNSICDGFVDCDDNSDEFFCPYDTVKGFRFQFEQGDCLNNTYSCGSLNDDKMDNVECISSDMICNGNIDCNNHLDETFCPYITANSQDFPVFTSTVTISFATITPSPSLGSTLNALDNISSTSISIITNTTKVAATEPSSLITDSSTTQNKTTMPLLKSTPSTKITVTESSTLITTPTTMITQNVTTSAPLIIVDQLTSNNSSQVYDIKSSTPTPTTYNNNQDYKDQQDLNNSTILLSSFIGGTTGTYVVLISVILVLVNTIIIIILIFVLVLLYRRTAVLKRNQMRVKQSKNVNQVNCLLNNLSKWDDD